MEKIVKYYRGVVRGIDQEKKTGEVVISDESLDRYKERVLVDSFKYTIKDFMKHPVMLSSHAYRGLLNQIGMFEKIKVDKEAREVVAKTKWFAGEGNPEADWGFKLAEKGIAAFSIGFISNSHKDYDSEEEMKENGGSRRDYTDIELLEVSQVLVPANPSALQKSFDEEKDPFLKDYYEEILKLAEELLKETEEKKKPKEDEDECEESKKEEEEKKEEDEMDSEDKGWEETDNEIRHRLKDPSLFSSFRYSGLKKDKPRVFAIYGKYKETSKWAIQALRFPKGDGWTMASAKKWVSEHSDIGKDFEWPDYISDFSNADEAMEFSVDERASTTLFFTMGLVETVISLMKEVCSSVKEMQKDIASLKDKNIDTDKEEEQKSDEQDLDSVLGEEKLAELKVSLFGTQVSDEERVRKMFEDMNKELSEKFSVQS